MNIVKSVSTQLKKTLMTKPDEVLHDGPFGMKYRYGKVWKDSTGDWCPAPREYKSELQNFSDEELAQEMERRKRIKG